MRELRKRRSHRRADRIRPRAGHRAAVHRLRDGHDPHRSDAEAHLRRPAREAHTAATLIFWGRGDRVEAPPERRQLRRVPRVLGSSFRLVWEAAPGRFLASLAPQIVTAVTTGAQLVITRDLIAAVLATGSGGDLSRVGTLLAEMIGLSLISSAAGLIQNQQQSMLSAIVERHTNSVLLDRIIAIDLKRFETPEFQDLLRRAMNAMGRMMGVTRSEERREGMVRLCGLVG